MQKIIKNWATDEANKRSWMHKNSLYRENFEHASCGVGMVVSIEGKPSRKVVELGIDGIGVQWMQTAKLVMEPVFMCKFQSLSSMIK
jgi:glutamate synthase (NADPH/NADH) large chain